MPKSKEIYTLKMWVAFKDGNTQAIYCGDRRRQKDTTVGWLRARKVLSDKKWLGRVNHLRFYDQHGKELFNNELVAIYAPTQTLT